MNIDRMRIEVRDNRRILGRTTCGAHAELLVDDHTGRRVEDGLGFLGLGRMSVEVFAVRLREAFHAGPAHARAEHVAEPSLTTCVAALRPALTSAAALRSAGLDYLMFQQSAAPDP
jgi:hypothetical protein